MQCVLSQTPFNYDLILTDYNLSDMTGVDMLLAPKRHCESE
jgi:CheY-like chemotaxis protein